jgi:hypothetical protein
MATDCNDGASGSEIHPGAEEVCDGVDNDCSDAVDDGLTAPSAFLTDGVCAGAVKVCEGSSGWAEPAYGSMVGYESTEMSCDDLDNDCDGVADEDDVCGSAEPECADSDDGATDIDGDSCADYIPAWCGGFDDDDFDSMSMCCACGGGDDIITSDGSYELPMCTWSSGCEWDESVQEECATALCERAGYEAGTFVSADHSMCAASATSDAYYYWDTTTDSYGYGSKAKESTITAQCGDSECTDTDEGATDATGDTCADYVDHPSWCGGYDVGGFDSMSMCCACGGGG